MDDDLTGKIIGSAMEVHKRLGPGLLESAYEACLCYELHLAGLTFKRQVPLPIIYRNTKLDSGYRIDMIVEIKLFWSLSLLLFCYLYTKRSYCLI